MPRYEYSEGTSNKFWEIKLDGASFTATWGRIGTTGQTQLKTFKSDAEAKRAYDKLIEEKLKKGYELAGGGEDEDGDEDGESFPSEASESNPELEKVILENPEKIEARLVYADWLQSHGDPRGEWIMLEHELAKNPKDKKLISARDTLFKNNRPRFLGPLARWEKTLDGTDQEAFKWKLGFIQSVRLGFDSYANDDQELDLGDALGEILAHVSGRFLEEVIIGVNSADGEAEYQSLVTALGNAARPSLRKLHIADFEYPDQIEMSWTHLGNLSKVWKAVPRLETLIVQGGTFTLGDIALPELKHAEFRTGGLAQSSAASIAKANWPKLEYLDIWFGDDNYGGDATIDDILPILEGTALPKLKHLGLMNSQFANDIVQALPGAKILKQLETLDLSMGVLGDDSLEPMLEQKDRFKHLRKLNLNQNLIGDAGIERAKALGPNVLVDDQREPYDEESRYVAVGE